MRLIVVLLHFIIISITTFGQSLTGEYRAYHGHTLTLKGDSTFRYEWSFDLASSWTIGRWSVSGRILNLSTTYVYDTLTREGKLDSLILSDDIISSRIEINEYVVGLLSSGGQNRRIDRVPGQLALRRKRLYLIDESGRVDRMRESGIWDEKKRPSYYFKTK